MKFLIKKTPNNFIKSVNDEISSILNRHFDNLYPDYGFDEMSENLSIPVEVRDKKDEYDVRAELPGVKKEDIDVELDNEFMTVTAEIDEEKEEKEEKEKNEKYHTCEFRYGKYKRTISFDQPIKQDEAKAEYKNGVLKIIIPKQHAENIKQAKRLEIE